MVIPASIGIPFNGYLTQPVAKLSQLFGITCLVGKNKPFKLFFLKGPGRLSEVYNPIIEFMTLPYFIGLRRGVPRGGGSLMFPKVPQSSLGILRVPQLPPPLNTPGPLRTLQLLYGNDGLANLWFIVPYRSNSRPAPLTLVVFVFPMKKPEKFFTYTRWAPDPVINGVITRINGLKKLLSGVITLLIGVITTLITSRGLPCRY